MTAHSEITSQLPAEPEWLAAAIEAALDRKAVHLLLLDLRGLCDYTDYLMICSGTSDRQVRAIGDAIRRRLRDCGARALHQEGEKQGRWVLLDYGEVIMHLFDEPTRKFYRLERLWDDAPVLAEITEPHRDSEPTPLPEPAS